MKFFAKIIFLFLFFYFSFLESKTTFDCEYFTEKYGKEFKLPNKLLTSIALVESGIKKKGNFVSWPWTLNVDGRSKYFKGKDQALKFLKENYLKKKNIDVGCMQISMKFHRKKFESLEKILDPESNVKYAATYLKKLFKQHRTWNEAVSRYHSSIPERKKKYLHKVQNYWSKLRQKKLPTKPRSRSLNTEKVEYFRKQLAKQKFM